MAQPNLCKMEIKKICSISKLIFTFFLFSYFNNLALILQFTIPFNYASYRRPYGLQFSFLLFIITLIFITKAN